MSEYGPRRPRRGLIATLVTMLCLGTGANAVAHTLGQGYIFMNVGQTTLDGHVELMLTDLNKVMDLDTDNDGRVSEAEVLARIEDVRDYVAAGVGLGSEEADFPLQWTDYEVRRVPEGQYLIQNYVADVAGSPPDVMRIRYELLYEADPEHRGFLVIPVNVKSPRVDKGEETTVGFSPDQREQIVDLTSFSPWQSFVTFVRHGAWHIWIGIDHVLFLLALILPAVLVRQQGRWQPVKDVGPAAWQVVKIVTLFTIAHTFTLSLAALDIIRLPPRLVESVIAASVVIAAVNNVYPILRGHIGAVVFGFGLFHGFGFASVLGHLVQNQKNLVINLLGFNIGVELGQIVIVLLAFPLLLLMRRTNFYLRMLLPVGSAVIALLAIGWLTERAFDVDFLPI